MKISLHTIQTCILIAVIPKYDSLWLCHKWCSSLLTHYPILLCIQGLCRNAPFQGKWGQSSSHFSRSRSLCCDIYGTRLSWTAILSPILQHVLLCSCPPYSLDLLVSLWTYSWHPSDSTVKKTLWPLNLSLVCFIKRLTIISSVSSQTTRSNEMFLSSTYHQSPLFDVPCPKLNYVIGLRNKSTLKTSPQSNSWACWHLMGLI